MAYQADIKKVAAITDAKKQKLELEKFNSKYYAFIKTGYAKANIDEVSAKASISQLLKGFNYKITYGEFMAITGFYTKPATPVTAGGCVELTCPMDVKNTTLAQNNLGFGFTTNGDCRAHSYSSTVFVLNQENVSATGKRTQIEREMTRVDLSCPLNYDISGNAFAIIGFGHIDGSVGLRVTGPNVDTPIEFASNWAVAPLIWYQPMGKTGENNFMECSFTPSANGGNYTIQGFAKTYSISAVLSGSNAIANMSEFSPIRVCQIKK